MHYALICVVAARIFIAVIVTILHVLKSGGRGIEAPEAYGSHKTLYNRFVRWTAKGVAPPKSTL